MCVCLFEGVGPMSAVFCARQSRDDDAAGACALGAIVVFAQTLRRELCDASGSGFGSVPCYKAIFCVRTQDGGIRTFRPEATAKPPAPACVCVQKGLRPLLCLYVCMFK